MQAPGVSRGIASRADPVADAQGLYVQSLLAGSWGRLR